MRGQRRHSRNDSSSISTSNTTARTMLGRGKGEKELGKGGAKTKEDFER